MAKQDLKEAAKILEGARKAQQFTIAETGKKKTNPVVVIVAGFVIYLIINYLNLI